jgi:hypothetical protein
MIKIALKSMLMLTLPRYAADVSVWFHPGFSREQAMNRQGRDGRYWRTDRLTLDALLVQRFGRQAGCQPRSPSAELL